MSLNIHSVHVRTSPTPLSKRRIFVLQLDDGRYGQTVATARTRKGSLLVADAIDDIESADRRTVLEWLRCLGLDSLTEQPGVTELPVKGARLVEVRVAVSAVDR